jgi:uncharacterized protein YmfQ (DUF2313 family)
MTISCQSAHNDPYRCPSKYELWRQVLALLPRGRAWQNKEDSADVLYSGVNSQVGTFELGLTGIGTEPSYERLTGLQRYWLSYAEVLEYLHQRACALVAEFFCSTIAELRNEWQVEYGYPDPCDPWQSLCEKVTAQGGATCAYLSGLAASRGWALSCSDCDPNVGAHAGCAHAGCARTCGCIQNVIFVTVDLANSQSYTAPPSRSAYAGSARAGSAISSHCPPGAEPLQCLIERFKPAHVKAIYIYEGA